MKNILVSTGVAVLVVLLGFVFFTPERPVGSVVSPEVFERFYAWAGLTRGDYTATSTTATSDTIAGFDILEKGEVYATPLIADATLTYPATSTIKNFLPKAGMSTSQCWNNSTTTATIELRLAAGTGWDFERTATSTGIGTDTDLINIGAGNSACVTYTRMPATATAFDIKARFQFFTNLD